MHHKTIIQGRIEFGNEKTFEKATRMYKTRCENYYKNDVLFELEEIFFEEDFHLSIPRYVKQVYDKAYKNTAALLEYIVQFGISGELNMWLLDEGKILHASKMEPDSDKVAVQSFIRGKNLSDEKGKEEEAITALTKAIEKYNRHAQAYERRAKVNFILKREHDAIRDYNKSLALDPDNPYAYFGLAEVQIKKEEFAEAADSLGLAIKKSVALQDIHWRSRKLKGKIHNLIGEYEKAKFELKLFTKRKFPEDHPNNKLKGEAFFDYGITLMELEEYDEAVAAFESALDFDAANGKKVNPKRLRFRGVAKHKAGKNGFKKDIKEAADLGDKEAVLLLKNLS
jgi:tetratricopeptide (TPR) repeat protein